VVSNELALSVAQGYRRLSERDVAMPGAERARLVRGIFEAQGEGGEREEVAVASLYAIGPDGLAVMLRTVEPAASPTRSTSSPCSDRCGSTEIAARRGLWSRSYSSSSSSSASCLCRRSTAASSALSGPSS
jgi:hypothetical protein